ncbi:MAG: response regulator [Nevskiaceae bacterium]|nr:MAG: response regulator [Nevskiaceae bacterium]
MLKALRILLVEDDAEDALLFRRRCPPQAQVQQVSDAAAALIAARAGGLDVCFCDYRLGAESGLDVVRAFRAEGLRIPVVMITGEDIEALGENALLAGATDFIPKDDLDAATIGRVARWALIRRHVENRREDALSDAALSQWLGQAPKSSAAAANTGAAAVALRRVLYLSRARRAMSAQELLILCSRFAAANARTHVTGVLICAGNRFMQVIEGDPAVITVLLQKISQDPRHGDLAVVLDEPTPTRLFAQWAMGSLHLNERYDDSPGNWQGVQTQVQRLLRDEGMTREAISQLIRSLPRLLAAPASVSL